MARIKTAYMILAACLLAINSYCQDKTDHRYVFFLHNMFIEINGPEGVHPEYGKAEYREILNVFKKEQFNVISEVRARNTDVNEYALKTIKQIDSLLKKGVPPSHITVIGTSKGGYIAMTISARLKNPGVNFVFIGSCSKELASAHEFDFCGNILSIYEKGDVLGQSCATLKEQSNNAVSHFKELELNTGLKHGFLYKALKEWTEPSIKWAKGQY